jgi:hypothetical protein
MRTEPVTERSALLEIVAYASDPFAADSVALRACLLAAREALGAPDRGRGSLPKDVLEELGVAAVVSGTPGEKP